MKINKYWIILIIIVLIIVVFIFMGRDEEVYQFKGNTLDYSQERGNANYEIISKTSNDSFDTYKIKFKSRPFLDEETIIYGLLYVPRNSDGKGVVLLPGGGGTKESRERIALKIIEENHAVLTIDQRGIGETDGSYLSFEQDFQIFSQEKEAMQHLAVYDVLKAGDVLRNFEESEKKIEDVGIVGESMGARYGIIAAAIDKNFKGVIAISTSGFHVELNPLKPPNDYLVSVDPDHYIGKISPNFIAVFHGSNDTMISVEDAQITFDKAKEPKKFFIARGCQHGYCDEMGEELKKALEEMFEE